MTLTGYDIAAVNGPSIINIALAGQFVICKASEGQSFTDGLHDTFVAKARAAGKLVGHYHYGRPDTKDASDAVKEADHFIAAAKARPGDTMWLDFEKSETIDQRGSWPEWVIAFCVRVGERTGAACGIYLNNWFATQILDQATTAQAAAIRAFPLWKAAWPTDPATGPGDLHGWPVLTCWQWTDKQGTLGIDRDIFYGDASTWRTLGVGAPTTQEDNMSDITVRNPVTGKDTPIADALWSMWYYAFHGAQDSGAALEIIKTLAASPKDQLTEAEIEAAAQRGAQAAIDAEIDSASVTLNVNQPSATP